jgi:hypothetical protein
MRRRNLPDLAFCVLIHGERYDPVRLGEYRKSDGPEMPSSLRHRTWTAGLAAVMLACGAVAAQSAPVILNVTITGAPGQSFGLVITGTGFGTGPKNVSYPYYGDTRFFRFIDKHPTNDGPGTPRSYVDWSAGFENAKMSDPVTLDYMVWNDTEIQFCGFYGEYGQNGYIMTSGDKFEVKITGADGSHAIYMGTVP